MRVLDSQVHIVGPDTPERPWVANLQGSIGGSVGAATARHFGKDALISAGEMLVAMEQAGVFGGLLVVSTHYGFDNRHSLDAAAAHPDRFRVVGKLDPAAPDIDEQVGEWASDPRTCGLRFLVLSDEHRGQLLGGHFDAYLGACRRHGVPVSVYAAGNLDALGETIRRFDGLVWTIDHLGLAQPPVLQRDPEPFERLPQLLDLAAVPGVTVKLSGLPTLSRAAYPFADLAEPLEKLATAFGIERLVWGSDWTRTKGILPYAQNLAFLRDLALFSAAEMDLICAGNLRRIAGWPDAA